MRGTYDYMHTNGGPIDPTPYEPSTVYNYTLAEDDIAFAVDGAHLQSQGAVNYLKQRNDPLLSPSDHLKCSTPDCSELR